MAPTVRTRKTKQIHATKRETQKKKKIQIGIMVLWSNSKLFYANRISFISTHANVKEKMNNEFNFLETNKANW